MSILSHRVLQRLAANSMTRRGSVISASTYRPSTPESCLTSQPTSSPLPASRVSAVTTQRRRPFSPDNPPCYASGDRFRSNYNLRLTRRLRNLLGPTSDWVLNAPSSHLGPHRRRVDPQGCRGNHQRGLQHGTRRPGETTPQQAPGGHLPRAHELARLNKEAPRFRLEDLGPLAPGQIPWVTWLRPVSKDGPPLDAKTETRAFLYFPDGSPKATALFLAVNSELMYPRKALTQSPPIRDEVAYSRKPLALLAAFRIVYEDWEDSRPSVTARIEETSRLPIICNFQENVFGCIFYPVRKKAPNTRMGLTPLDITDFDRKTSML